MTLLKKAKNHQQMKRMNTKQNLLNPLNLLTISRFSEESRIQMNKWTREEPESTHVAPYVLVHLCTCVLCTCSLVSALIVHRKGQLGN